MGLDVYLSRCENWADKVKLEKEFQEKVELYNIEWDSPAYNELSESMGLLGGEYPTETIEMDSTIDPEHMFKIGYFRSSYNAGGINHVIADRIGKAGLYYIFDDPENYHFVPNWAVAMVRVNEVIEEFEKEINRTGGFQVHKIRNWAFDNGVNNSNDALNAFMDETLNRGSRFNSEFGNWYSNKAGDFMVGGLKVHALISGKDYDNKLVTYMIYETDEQDWDWYVKALKIVKETILWVLEQDNPDEYGLSWSG